MITRIAGEKSRDRRHAAMELISIVSDQYEGLDMGVFAVDDPMLALLARFAGCCEDADSSEDAFLRQQFVEIRDYIASYPASQQQERALEWVERNAERYRRRWHERLVADQAPASRCPDCPLERLNGEERCEIHGRWLQVLHLYLAGDTSSRQYVEDTLDLLRRHKERLRTSVAQASMG